MATESILSSLLSGIEFDDPRLYDFLNALSTDFYALRNRLEPPQTTTAFGITGQLIGPQAVSAFTAEVETDSVKLTWAAISILTTFEIRYISGIHDYSSWNLADVILTTTTLSAQIDPHDPLLITGFHTFLIKAIDSNGIYSTLASTVTIEIPQIQAVTITSLVVGNSVLLYWTEAVSAFRIDHYNLYKDSILQGQVAGTFKSIFESSGGIFTYVLIPVDFIGNIGTPSSGALVQVQNPADFVLHDTLTSTFTGTKTNCQTENIAGISFLLACIDTTKSFEDHFIDNAWTSPQDQVDAGYDLYIEPTETTGSYQEVFDFGSIISSVIIVLNWNLITLVGSVATGTTTIEYSTDGTTWSAPATGTSTFASSIRYVRATLNFVGASDKSLIYVYNFQCLLNVHYEQDGGIVTANSGDAGGTVVTLNKTFKSVISITLTPNSTSARYASYDFAFPLNPTTFKVLVYDDAGVRKTADVTWLARGIL